MEKHFFAQKRIKLGQRTFSKIDGKNSTYAVLIEINKFEAIYRMSGSRIKCEWNVKIHYRNLQAGFKSHHFPKYYNGSQL